MHSFHSLRVNVREIGSDQTSRANRAYNPPLHIFLTLTLLVEHQFGDHVSALIKEIKKKRRTKMKRSCVHYRSYSPAWQRFSLRVI